MVVRLATIHGMGSYMGGYVALVRDIHCLQEVAASTTIKKSKRSSIQSKTSSIQSTDAARAATTTTAPAPDAECSHTSPNAAVDTTAAENACINTAATNALSTSFVAVCFIADVYITKEKDDAGGSRITKKEADASMR
ncbi:hypothetical protein ISN45_At05g039520 [Arabidopsis thaliana x Arabidopsis arenosa]|uniref:Uncharacterized protein n=1 Tax=Arabidopsis thaliana x Arabidopsis arenosa TaxID=1240361 RepID=A0A8T2CZZ2_9BRAS|nr:hypothetical protein ISN45_At05g039520 [Arabidopsis thaliana x Arabidopsis arenosa]